jgi:hypothetical protein
VSRATAGATGKAGVSAGTDLAIEVRGLRKSFGATRRWKGWT